MNIESLVSARQTAMAYAAIKQYLAKNRKYTNARIRAANWYRRLGSWPLALSVLKGERESRIDLSLPSGEEQLTLCRILNSLGSTRYALRMLSKMKLNEIPNRLLPVIGNIWLSNDFYDQALSIFENALATHEHPGSDTYQVALISLADAHAGLKNYDKAIAIVENIRRDRRPDTIHFIASSALGEYLLKSGQPKEALKVLSESQHYIKEDDQSTDPIFWWKWWGVTQIHVNNFDAGIKALNKAFQMRYKPQIKPEAWLEILYWIGYAKRLKNPDDVPTEWLSIMTMPTVAFPFTPEIIKHFHGKVFCISQSTITAGTYSEFLCKYQNANIIDEVSDLECFGGSKELNLNLTTKMVSLLLRSFENKLSRNRLVEVLWPDELYSFHSLDLRLKSLIKEARKKGFEIKQEDGCLEIVKTNKLPTVLYHPNLSVTGLDFLLKNEAQFKRTDVEKYYSMNKTFASRILKKWLDEELIEPSQLYSYSVTQKVRDINFQLQNNQS